MAVQTLAATGINLDQFGDHGAAVLGIVLMKENDQASSGIVPAAKASVVSQWRPDSSPNDADAILYATQQLRTGDVLLLEIQSFYLSWGESLWPAETQAAVFDVIRLATTLGIIVIEPAGNGHLRSRRGNDLDLFSDHRHNTLNPAGNNFLDSGAIMVAAATATVPHTRLAISNYGKRIDCFAWGESVITAGNYPGRSRPGTHCYTRHFNGTSSAAAIIAGAALAIQSIALTRHHRCFSAVQMRSLLGSEAFGTESAGGKTTDKIGVMPDLRKIIEGCLNRFPFA